MCDDYHFFKAKPRFRAVYWYEKENPQTRQTETEQPHRNARLPDRHSRTLRYCLFFISVIYFPKGDLMNITLVVAFGLGALGSIIRLVLLLTAPKDHTEK
jgi:hypothetical protein